MSRTGHWAKEGQKSRREQGRVSENGSMEGQSTQNERTREDEADPLSETTVQGCVLTLVQAPPSRLRNSEFREPAGSSHPLTSHIPCPLPPSFDHSHLPHLHPSPLSLFIPALLERSPSFITHPLQLPSFALLS